MNISLSDAPQRSKEWHEARKGLVTASAVGAILGLDPYRDRDDVVRQMVRDYHGAEREFLGNIATEHGTFHEYGALVDYQMETGNRAENCGFFARDNWIGASPDALVGDDGLLEIKCPYRMRAGEGEHRSINEQPHYYAQMQVQMYVTGRQWCDFYQWAAHATMLERVQINEIWLAQFIPELLDFYYSVVGELGNKAHLQPLRREIETPHAAKLLKEYDEVCDQLDFAAARKKEIIDELVRLAKERDALVCGRKLTKAEREGAVSYAQVVKNHCPAVDLEPYRGKPSVSWRLS
jgi:putative phage-type endonuclease